MNQTYGLNLRVQFTPGPSMPDVMSQLVQQHQANKPASSDLFLGDETHVVTGMNADLLVPEDWSAWSPSITDSRVVAPQGVAVAMASRLSAITYNTDLVSADDVPRSYQDLLKSEYKGKVATIPYAANFARMASPEFWGPDRTVSFVRALSAQVGGFV